MEITMQMLMDVTKLKTIVFPEGCNPFIRDVELYIPGKTRPRSSVLYVAQLDDALTAVGEDELIFICPKVEDMLFRIHSRNIIHFVYEDEDLYAILNRVFSAFSRLSRWLIDLQRSVISNAGVQELFDISEDIIGTSITIMDSTYKLLAYTHHYIPDDEPNVYLIEHGYHSEKTRKNFERFNRFSEEYYKQDIIVSHDRYLSNYVTVKKFFKQRSHDSLHLVLICSHRDVTEGLIDMFRALSECIDTYARNGYPYAGKYSAFDSLLHDLLDSGLSHEELTLRAEKAEVPFSGLFNLYKIDQRDEARQSISYLALLMSHQIPQARVSFYKNSIIILNIYRNESEIDDRFGENIRLINSMARDFIGSIGISAPFRSVDGLRCAYMQADAAIDTRRLGMQRETGSRILRFEDCYIQHMLMTALSDSTDVYRSVHAESIIDKLLEYEKEKNYSYVEFLRVYLLHERRSTEVGSILHLHRNTVIYPKERLESLLNVDFDNPELRIKLLVEIYRRRFMKALKD